MVGSLDGGPALPLDSIDSRAEYLASGHLLFVNHGTLLAQRFDLDNVRLIGQPTVVAEALRVFKPTGAARFTTSRTGLVAFETDINRSPILRGSTGADGRSATRDRCRNLSKARDWLRTVGGGRRRRRSSHRRLRYLDSVRPSRRAATLHLHRDRRGESDLVAEGTRIVFRSDRAGPPDIHAKAVEGTGNQEVVLAALAFEHPLDVSADGRHSIYLEEDRVTRADPWMFLCS